MSASSGQHDQAPGQDGRPEGQPQAQAQGPQGCPSPQADWQQAPLDELPLLPLFPLPNIVLFPRAVLPLHIFEDRYRAMTRHALEGDRRIAMALLRPGWEKCYYAKPAIDPIVCVGTILTHEELPDGKFNFLLQGTLRARVVAEVGNEPYRLARLEPLRETPAPPGELKAQRRRMLDLFTHHALTSTGLGWQFAKLLATTLPTDVIADIAAYTFLDDVNLKQSLLADTDVARRVARTLEAVECACLGPCPGPILSVASQSPSGSLRRLQNPSLN